LRSFCDVATKELARSLARARASPRTREPANALSALHNNALVFFRAEQTRAPVHLFIRYSQSVLTDKRIVYGVTSNARVKHDANIAARSHRLTDPTVRSRPHVRRCRRVFLLSPLYLKRVQKRQQTLERSRHVALRRLVSIL